MIKILQDYFDVLMVKNKPKIFCIGLNKTGTTSLKKLFDDLGFKTGNQRDAEKLLKKYQQNDFQPIIDYCRKAQVFQDVPFSMPGTYKQLDEAFPGSKFILTIRDSADQWYHSLTTFHSKMFGGGKLPTAGDLRNARYVWPGWIWEFSRCMFSSPENDPYRKADLIDTYVAHITDVQAYFKHRSEDLITINVADNLAYRNLMHFLNINSPYNDFPWENQTDKISIRK